MPSCVATAIFVLVTAHFLPEAECVRCQSRLRVASGYSLYDAEVRRCMSRLVLFFTPPNSKRAQAIFDKYNKEANHNVARQAQAAKWNV